MNTASIYTLTRDILGTNSSVLSDSKLLEWLNIALGNRTLDILKYQVDRNASMEMAKTNLVDSDLLTEGQNGYDGEYSFPSNLLRPIRMEISYDGDTFVPASIYDIGENEDSEISLTNSKYSVAEPGVRFERESYFIRPLPTEAVTNGIRIWYEKRQTELTDGGTPEFESNLHSILAFDLAEMELMRHSRLYSSETAARIRREATKAENRFIAFYNDRMKRNFKISPKVQDCS
jgi:hypothetical protein